MLPVVFAFPQWTWQNPLPQCNSLNSVFFSGANTGYAAGDCGILLKTINGGTTWSILPSGTTHSLRSICFTDFNTGYAVGEGGVIIKTTNGGINWSTLSTGTIESLSSVYFTDANTGYTVADNNLYGNNIFKTTNGGADWTILFTGDCFGLSSVYFTDFYTGYVVGTGGTILKTTTGGIVSIGENLSNSSTFTIYPNPCSSKITITSNKDIAGETIISVFNIPGQQMIQSEFPDQNRIEMDVSALIKGIYLVKIQTGAGIEVKKLIIQ